jgi:thiol-disulfide isomerase/thioredoxin
MQANFLLLLLLSIIGVKSNAQDYQSTLLNIGDSAPPLRVLEWLKGEPVQRFEKGKVYVVEFWATWCKPCKAAMPHLSALAVEYRDRAVIVGIDIYEKKTTSMQKVKAFVDSMGSRMDYTVATEDSNFTIADWLEATGEKNNGIPNTFVVDGEGRLAWIGHPKDLDEVLPKIVNNTWDVKEELVKRKFKSYLRQLDKEANDTLNNYTGDAYKQDYIGKPDSALLVISYFLKKEPKLKYAPIIAFHTFSALLKTDPLKAYEYGKAVIVTSTYEDPPYHSIWEAIEWYSDKLKLTPQIYELGAEAYQARINAYPESVSPNFYYKMAGWYWRANDKSKAIDATQKAIEALKNEKSFSATQMASFESRLQQYKEK